MIDVKGKWTLITGASRGVGYHAALAMAREGSNLIVHSRHLSHTRKVEEEAKAFGVDVLPVEAELSRPDAVHAMLDTVGAEGIAVDIVFNNAAVQVAYRKDFWQTPVEDFDLSFRINFTAPALICHRLIPPMIERGFGRVINVTSGIRNEPEQAGYAASKAALDKFTKDLASRLEGGNVLINLADPGWCRTDLGGPNAPNAPESVVPGIVVGAFVNDGKSGRFFPAQRFAGMTLAEAVADAETIEAVPYAI